MKKDKTAPQRHLLRGDTPSESPPREKAEPSPASAEEAKKVKDIKPLKDYVGPMALVKCPKLGNQPLFPESPYGPGVALANWARGKEGYRCVKCGDIHPLYGKI